MNIADQIVYMTTRLGTVDAKGATGSGTGFFYRFLQGEDGYAVPAIVTNKHVLRDAARIEFTLSLAGPPGSDRPSGYHRVTVDDFAAATIWHPDINVDLAIILIGPILQQVRASGKEPFFKALGANEILSDPQLSELVAVEEVHMVGYPQGIWDSRNNLPIVRRGITATPVYSDYEGGTQFMIDMACFPGSSGSPVFLMNNGMFATKQGNLHAGVRFGLLGVLYAGPKMVQPGRIEVIEGPTKATPIAFTDIMINLGYCIKAKRIVDFDKLIIQRGIAPGKGYTQRDVSR